MEPDIEEWRPGHERWSDLQQLIDELDQTRWVASVFDWHKSSHMLVALNGQQVVGFLRLVIQAIGPDEERAPLRVGNEELLEAKVMAFGVAASARRSGIGRRLQVAALTHARAMGCYQMRSHSGGAAAENHALKIAMGFAIYPAVRRNDPLGLYFIMPLRGAAIE